MSKKGIKHYKTNQDFFKVWSSEMAYVLGWIASDGCIQYVPKVRYGIRFELGEKEPLEMIKEIMDLEIPIHKRKDDDQYSLYIRGKQITKDVINLGIMPNKTFKLNPLDIPIEFFRDFVRGYFDGDGCAMITEFSKRSKSLYTRMTSGSKPFLQWIGNTLKEEVGIIPKIYTEHDKYHTLQYASKESMALYYYLYKDAKYFLSRKKEIFEQAKNLPSCSGIIKCKRCNADIVRTSNRQKWCSDCKRIVVREREKKRSQKRKEERQNKTLVS